MRFAFGDTLNLVDSTGVQYVGVSGSTATGTVSGLGAIANLIVTNQNHNVTFNDATAAALNLTFDKVGSTDPNALAPVTVTINDANVKSESIRITDSNIDLHDHAGVPTTLSVAATGVNIIHFVESHNSATSLAVTGTGSLDTTPSGNFTALKTLTVADGGIKLNAAGSIETVTTGAGKDTLILANAGLKSVATGAGDDSVTVNSPLAATSTVDLGKGDDTLTLGATPVAGATMTGGDGTDTFALTTANYAAVSAFTAANLEKIAGFEVLSITDPLAAGPYDVSKIAGIGSFTAAAGIAGGVAVVTGLAADSTVTLAGPNNPAGTLSLALKSDTSADVVNLVLNSNYAENNDATATITPLTQNVLSAKVETLNVNSTGKASVAFDGAAGNKADGVNNSLVLTDNDIVNLKVTGDQAFTYNTTATQTKLASIDASALKAGATIDGSASVAASAALDIKGSATEANLLVGGAANDTITGGAKADNILGGLGGDTLTGGAGNDTFWYTLAAQSTIAAGNTDTIKDFTANTIGNAATNATEASADHTKWNGDVLQVAATGAANPASGVNTGVFTNAANATTFLATASATNPLMVHAALDSTDNNLYIDNDGNGVADLFIHLTGVTTITNAAFDIV